jgi:hypothetical protein
VGFCLDTFAAVLGVMDGAIPRLRLDPEDAKKPPHSARARQESHSLKYVLFQSEMLFLEKDRTDGGTTQS